MEAKKRASSVKFEEPVKRMQPGEQPQRRVLGGQESVPDLPQQGDGPTLKRNLTEGEDLREEQDEEGKRVANYSLFKDMVMREEWFPGLTPEYREWVHNELEPLVFDSIFAAEVRQSVRVSRISDATVTFRTITKRDMLDVQNEAGPSQLTENEPNLKHYAYVLCLSLYKYNDIILPPYRSGNEWSEKLFERRMEVLLDLPWQTIQFLDVHRRWFVERCGAVFADPVAGPIKNG